MTSKSAKSDREDDGRRRTFIEDARRAQIVECAIETLAELGYAQASLAQIAQRAGISKGAICYHFATKDELIREAFVRTYDEGSAIMRGRVEREPDARGRLLTYIQSNIEFMEIRPSYLVALVEIAANFREADGTLSYRATAESSVADVEKILRWGQRRGEFRTFSPRVMAITIRYAIDAVSGQLASGATLDLPAYAKELVEIFDRATRAEET